MYKVLGVYLRSPLFEFYQEIKPIKHTNGRSAYLGFMRIYRNDLDLQSDIREALARDAITLDYG